MMLGEELEPWTHKYNVRMRALIQLWSDYL
jgi:hypothetical protein